MEKMGCLNRERGLESYWCMHNDLEKMARRAGFLSVDFFLVRIEDRKWLGNDNSYHEDMRRLAHVEAPDLSYPIMSFPGSFWQSAGTHVDLKTKK